MNKRIKIIAIVAVLVILVLIKFIPPNTLKVFLNYDENKYLYTMFENSMATEDETLTFINTYRRIDDKTVEIARNKEFLKNVAEKDIMKFVEEENAKARYNTKLLKSLRDLKEVDNMNLEKEELSIRIIIQNDKRFIKDSYVHYIGNLKIYLKDKIILFEDISNDNYRNTYFSMDEETLKLAQYIIDNPTNVSEEALNAKGKSLKNLVTNINNFNLTTGGDYSKDADKRNNITTVEYIRGIQQVKDFCMDNSIELTYVEPIEDRISRVDGHATQSIILKDLYSKGAETVQYFTDEESLNVDLSIDFFDFYIDQKNISEATTIKNVAYKSSMTNIGDSFNFKESKLNEFRQHIINDIGELDYNKLDAYINKCLSGEYSKDMWFINNIDGSYTESIRIENNTVYYKLIYNYVPQS